MSMNICPECGQPIASDDINLKEGVALCRACGKLSRLADIADQPSVDAAELTTPPPGCSYQEQLGGGLVVRASHRSIGAAIGTLAICLFWNGIVSVFVLFAIAGLYTHLVGPLPKWFPVPSSGKNGSLGPGIPLGETIFLCIFLMPFVLVGSGLVLAFFTYLLGRTELVVTGDTGRIRTGIGPLNWTRRFDVSRVTRVAIGQTAYTQNNQSKPLIVIDADRTIKFGSMLSEVRRAWMLSVLRLRLFPAAQRGRTGGSLPLSHR
jgi:hypothetical protein